jgi:hypothetical protein
MRLFRLGGIKRLFLSLALSFFLVLTLTSISWYSKPAKHTAYDFDADIDQTIKERANPSDRLDSAIDDVIAKQPNSGFDWSTAIEAEDTSKSDENLKPDYLTYLWDAILDGAGAGAAFVAIAAGLFLVLSTINQYFNEVSIGWKRLSIVSSFLITLLIGSYSYLSQALRGDDMFLSLLAMPISMALLLYSKVIYAWIKDGFKADKI